MWYIYVYICHTGLKCDVHIYITFFLKSLPKIQDSGCLFVCLSVYITDIGVFEDCWPITLLF